MDRRTFLGRAFLGLTAAASTLALAGRAQAGSAPVYAEDGVAIRGADAVAYFEGRGPVAGLVTERVGWRGAIWLFATPQNRQAFEWNPRSFAPRFGGYCAYKLSQGQLGPIDPHAYEILDGRLYLFGSLEFREVWRKDLVQNISLAESHWPMALG